MKNISKIFKKEILFSNVNINIEKGKIHGLIGPNGSGKSVLFKIICGFIVPDSGTIYFSPEYKKKNDDFPRHCGIVIDNPAYIGNLTGFENLKLLADINKEITEEDIKKSMLRLGLDWNIKQKVKDYSLGMRQKLSITQAIMENQQLLIFDEPFNGLDKKSADNLRELIREMNVKEGRTIIFTSHNQYDITTLSQVIYEIQDKHVIKVK